MAAASLASIVAAFLTSKLGVTGTLIGAGATSMMITVVQAILKAQTKRVTNKISGLSDGFPNQHVRLPGKNVPETPIEPKPPEGATARISEFTTHLAEAPAYLRSLPSARRRRLLLTGTLAGVFAMFVGLGGITGLEFASGKSLSCLVWSE